MSNEIKHIKHLHLCTAANYVTVNGFTKLVNENMDPSEHIFIVRDTPENKLQKVSQYDNVIFMPEAEGKDFKKLLAYMNNADKIYFHSMGWYWKAQLKFLMHPEIMKKSTWIEWGMDLFDWDRKDGNKFVRKIVNIIMKQWRCRVATVVAIFPADEKVYREKFNKNMNVMHAIYSVYPHENIDAQKPEKLHDDGITHILVGHSAVKSDYHFECLDALAHFADKPVKIHIPLTYGDMAYAEEVKKKAREIFTEDKLDFITENVPLDDYVKFLWDIDVGIFKVYRQIALGNICKLLYMTKKVYLPEGSLMYDCFTDCNTEIYSFDKLKDESFESFSSAAKSKEPSEYIMGRMTKDKVVEQWKKVFDN